MKHINQVYSISRNMHYMCLLHIRPSIFIFFIIWILIHLLFCEGYVGPSRRSRVLGPPRTSKAKKNKLKKAKKPNKKQEAVLCADAAAPPGLLLTSHG